MSEDRGVSSPVAYVFILVIVIGVAGVGFATTESFADNSVEETQIKADSFKVIITGPGQGDTYELVYIGSETLTTDDLEAIEVTNQSGGSIMTGPVDRSYVDVVWSGGKLEQGELVVSNLTTTFTPGEEITIIQHSSSSSDSETEDSATPDVESGSGDSVLSDTTTTRIEDVSVGVTSPSDSEDIENLPDADTPGGGNNNNNTNTNGSNNNGGDNVINGSVS